MRIETLDVVLGLGRAEFIQWVSSVASCIAGSRMVNP